MFLGFDALTWTFVAVGLVIAAVIFVRRRREGRASEWDPRPPNMRERIVAGVWLATFLLAVANDYSGWRLFGGYDKWVLGGLFFGGLLLFARLPGVRRT